MTHANVAAAAVLLVAFPPELGCETLTLSTTYPSPAGIYNQIITTGNGSKDTLLARDSGRVVVGSNSGGANKLVVNGGTRLVGNATVAGDVDARGLLINGVRLVWKEIVLPASPASASYGPWSSPYAAPAHADDCDGSPQAAYVCPSNLAARKTCRDVTSGGLTTGSEADEYGSPSAVSLGGAISSESCGGSWEEPYTCPNGASKTCSDSYCQTNRSGTVCAARSVTCRAPGAGFQDRQVTCEPGAVGAKLRVLTAE